MEKLKALWTAFQDKVGATLAIVIVVAVALGLLVHPVLGIAVGVGGWLYTSGKLNKVIDRVTGKSDQ